MSDEQPPIQRKAEIAALVQTFRSKPVNLNVLRSAAKALGEIGPPAVPYLIESLEDEDPRVRYTAVEQLGIIGDKPSVDKIVEAVQNQNEEYQIRSSAIEALGHIGATSPALAISVLTQILTNREEAEEFRDGAGYALAAIGLPAFPALARALTSKDEDWLCRSNAADALGQIGSPDAIPILAQMIDEATDEELEGENSAIYARVTSALNTIGSAEALAVLVRALEKRNLTIRYYAAQMLLSFSELSMSNGGAANPVIVAAFAKKLKEINEDEIMVHFAGMALGRMGEPGFIALKELVATGDKATRERARTGLEFGLWEYRMIRNT